MAEIVLGLASSHTPQISTSAEFWKEHAARDERNTQLLGRDGRFHSYDELLADADPALAGELEAPVWKDKFDRARVAVQAIGLFTRERLWDLPPDAEHFARIPKDIQSAWRSPRGTAIARLALTRRRQPDDH